jgi:hypothetical protein
MPSAVSERALTSLKALMLSFATNAEVNRSSYLQISRNLVLLGVWSIGFSLAGMSGNCDGLSAESARFIVYIFCSSCM